MTISGREVVIERKSPYPLMLRNGSTSVITPEPAAT